MSTGGAGNLECTCNGNYHDGNEFHFVEQPSFSHPHPPSGILARSLPLQIKSRSLLPPQIQHQKIITILLYTIDSFTTSHLYHHAIRREEYLIIVVILDGRSTNCIYMQAHEFVSSQHSTAQRVRRKHLIFGLGSGICIKVIRDLLVMNNLA